MNFRCNKVKKYDFFSLVEKFIYSDMFLFFINISFMYYLYYNSYQLKKMDIISMIFLNFLHLYLSIKLMISKYIIWKIVNNIENLNILEIDYWLQGSEARVYYRMFIVDNFLCLLTYATIISVWSVLLIYFF